MNNSRSEELKALREQGLAKTQRGKFNDNESAIFRTPEEAQEYLSKLRKIKKERTKPTPPTNLKSSDLNDWYSQQRQFELQERKKREEAESLLRGYRAKYENGSDLNKTISSTNGSMIAEGSIEIEENITVSDEIQKYEKDVVDENDPEKEEVVEVSDENDDEEKKEEGDANVNVDDSNALISEPADILDDNNSEGQENETANVDESSTKGEAEEENPVNEDEAVVQAEVVMEKEEENETPKLAEEDTAEENATEEDATSVVKEGWRNMVKNDPGVKFPAEANRYHLYVAHACPWAHRTVIVRNLKGLQDCIGITYVHPTWQFTKPGEDDHRGWVFGSKDGEPLKNTAGYGSFPTDWGEEEPHMNAKSIRELYEKANDDKGKYILPVLWDTKLNTIVSNESSEIIRMLNSEFNDFAKHPEIDLYPESVAKDIDAINSWVYPSFNNGVYRCGLASSQEAYDAAIDDLTQSFDKIDSILQKQRYIVGNAFTEADVRLFVTLLRFDEVYDVYFKTNTRSVAGTPALLNYVRDIYQMEGIKECCDMKMIKAHYYTSHVELNKYSIIPRGDNFVGLLRQPHDRENLST